MNSPVIRLYALFCMLLALSASAIAAEVPVPREAQLAVNAAQALSDQQLGSIQGSLAVLATSSEVQSLDWESMHPLLSTLQEHCPPCAIWFALPDGTYYTAETGLMDQTLKDRAYFGPLLDGENVLGDVVVSKSTGQLSAIIAVPISKDGQVVGALGASVFANNMAEYLAASLELPTGMSLLVLTADGQTLCATSADGPKWAEAIKSDSFKDAAGTVLLNIPDKAPVLVVYRVSAFNGWRYLVGMQ
jgi:hypothetical protein